MEAQQLIADFYGCDAAVLDDPVRLRETAHAAVKAIGAEIVEECLHRFSPQGISYIAVITTSHFSIHTWPEYGYAAVDVFSCSGEVPGTVCQALGKALGCQEQSVRTIIRELKGGEHS